MHGLRHAWLGKLGNNARQDNASSLDPFLDFERWQIFSMCASGRQLHMVVCRDAWQDMESTSQHSMESYANCSKSLHSAIVLGAWRCLTQGVEDYNPLFLSIFNFLHGKSLSIKA